MSGPTAEPSAVLTGAPKAPRNWSRIGSFHWRRFVVDAFAWIVAIPLAALIRYEGSGSGIPWVHIGWLILVAILLQLLLGCVFRVYLGRHPWGSFEGLLDVVATTLMVSGLLWIWTLIFPEIAHVPRSLILIAAPFAMLIMAGARYIWRYAMQQKAVKREGTIPVLLYGAGFVGDSMARTLTTDMRSSMVPVGILDDDPVKRHLKIHGVNVLGTLDNLEAVVAKTGATRVIVTMGEAPAEKMTQLQEMAKTLGLTVLITPSTEQILKQGVTTSDLRHLDIEDLLGRDQVDTDISEIAGYLNGKTVLVTGAGGSIGSQLCVEINKHGPGELILLDRDETGLQGTDIRIKGDGLLDTNEVVLADIRDAQALKDIFNDRKPDVVFHAAALKHLPMLEQYPDEAWKTNVIGTLNVLDAARESGVETLINISTDKAANPTSILGLSKRVAERLTAGAGADCSHRYLSVRFGNVIGSRGSMLPTFRTLIEEGKPLTVTHPDITRYFMTIPEACQLVLQAGAIGRVGEVLILDMGEPVRILDIAQKMIDLSGKPIEIRFTGLREGEKLHEELHNAIEEGEEVRPFHPLISHAPVAGLGEADLSFEQWQALVATGPQNRVTLADEFRRENDIKNGRTDCEEDNLVDAMANDTSSEL